MATIALTALGPAAPGRAGDEFVPRKVPEFTAEAFFQTTSFSGASFSPRGDALLFSSDASGVFNAYRTPFEGGPVEPLTNSTTHAVFAVSWFPEDDRILYTSDEGGNELNHLYVRELDGRTRDLTPGKLKARFFGWSTDKASFFVLTNEREPEFFDLYRYSAQDYARKMLLQNPGGYDVSAVSGDGRWVVLTRIRTNADSDLYLVDTRQPAATPRLVTAHEGDVLHGVYGVTHDNRFLIYETNEHGEFAEAWTLDFESGERARLVRDSWDVAFVDESENGRYRVVGINADAQTLVQIQDLRRNAPLELPPLPAGDRTGVTFSHDEQRLALYISSDTAAPNLFAVDLVGGVARPLTDAMNPAIRPEYLVDGKVIRYPSYDGLEIPAILYRPWSATADNPAPALVWVHGGPGGQSRKGYNPTIQHLVNHGYAVLAVNNRGSSGYGKTFHHMDDRRHGDVDLKDCIWGRRYLESLDWVDAKKIGIIGGSYGGFMVAAALTLEPDAFDVGVDIFGVTNWERTLQSIPPWWAAARAGLLAEMGDPATDAERHRRISPLFHAKNIKKPLLVIQGANDPRVLQVESDELVEAVRSNGVPVDYVLFPDEGHGFRRKENRITASNAYVRFLDKHLKYADN